MALECIILIIVKIQITKLDLETLANQDVCIFFPKKYGPASANLHSGILQSVRILFKVIHASIYLPTTYAQHIEDRSYNVR